MMKNWKAKFVAAMGLLAVTSAFCTAQQQLDLKGAVKIDGSSTVYPITEAVAEEFKAVAKNIRVTVGISGTGGGFKKFTVGETDISNASRPIKKTEVDLASQNAIEFIELPIAYDGLSIVVNRKNTWVDNITIDELKKIFLADSAAKTWKQVRDTWPDKPIMMYVPGTDSGTFDYFKEVVAGEKGAIRSDMSVSEDDNALVKGIAGNEHSIGFFGCAYYFENKDKLKVVPVINPKTNEAITPTPQTIENGSYAPFSRPLFIYVSAKAADRPEVNAFVNFYLKHVAELAAEVGYVRLPQSVYDKAAANFKNKRTGTQFINESGQPLHGPVTTLYN